MQDILKQIQSLKEDFSNILDEELEKEGPSQKHEKKYTELSNSLEDDLKPYANKAAQEVMNKLGIGIGEYVDRINPKEKTNELHQHKYRKVREYAADQLTPWEKFKGAKAENKSLPKVGEREAHKKEIYDIMKQYHIGDDSVAKSIIKGKKKMNDNNSYNEIMTKILNLKEDFMNLIEVEGLGQPASDVPPSTNKIKKDRKTKNGKVELVSVEDELFPYDGNKREQYRQKIIDTINGMIQGTATLEDLLQIVRQKKMPVKEGLERAVDVLEELILERNKENAEKKKQYELKMNNIKPTYKEKVQANIKRLKKESDDDHWAACDLADCTREGIEAATPYAESSNRKSAQADALQKKLSNKFVNRRQSANEKLEEAMELLETIKGDVKNHQKYHGGGATFSYKGNNYSYTPERGLRKEGKATDDRNPVKQIVDTENKEFDDVRKYKYDLGRQSRTVNKKLNKEIKELEKTEGKGAFPGKTNDTIKKLIDTLTVNSSNRADADKHFAEVNAKQKKLANDAKGVKYEARDFYNTKKSDSYGFKPTVKTSEALEGALQLLEGWAKDKRPEAAKKSIEGRRREYLNKLANVLDAADIYGSENVPDGDAKDLDRAEGRYAHAKKVSKIEEALKLLEGLFVNDGRKDLLWNDIAGRSDTPVSAASNVLKNKLNKAYKGTQKKMPVKEGLDKFEVAMGILEEMINEVSDKYVEGKRENYKIKRDKAIIRHAQTMTDENPEGDPELLKDRQSKIDRLNKFDEKNKRYKELKREGKIKPYNKEEK